MLSPSARKCLPEASTTRLILRQNMQLVFSTPGLVHEARGLGTLCAINCRSTQIRDRVVAEMREHGVHLGVCGESTVRFRPSLTFDSPHLEILLDRLNTVLANNNQ